MENESPYPNLGYPIHGHFNQDFDLWGDNVEKLVSFKEENDQTLHTLVKDEIDRFKRDHSANLYTSCPLK